MEGFLRRSLDFFSVQGGVFPWNAHLSDTLLLNCGFPSGSDHKESACNAGDAGSVGSIPRLERSPGEGNGYPLQCSCLENSIDRDGRLQSLESQRVEQDWWTNTNTSWVRGCQPRRYNNFIQTQIMSCHLAFYQDFYISNHPPSTQLGFFPPFMSHISCCHSVLLTVSFPVSFSLV